MSGTLPKRMYVAHPLGLLMVPAWFGATYSGPSPWIGLPLVVATLAALFMARNRWGTWRARKLSTTITVALCLLGVYAYLTWPVSADMVVTP